MVQLKPRKKRTIPQEAFVGLETIGKVNRKDKNMPRKVNAVKIHIQLTFYHLFEMTQFIKIKKKRVKENCKTGM